MRNPPTISELVATPASPAAREAGTIAFLRFVLNNTVVVDGAKLRRAHADGRLYVAWPSRRDARGIERFTLRPTHAARHALEAAVMAQLPQGIVE